MPPIVGFGFMCEPGHVLIEPAMPTRDFTLHLLWSQRHGDDPAQCWLRSQVQSVWRAA